MNLTTVQQIQIRDRIRIEDRILTAPEKQLELVKENSIYPNQFSTLLRTKYQGKSVGEVAANLNIAPEHVVKLLAGEWKPTKNICRQMGLKVAYALSEKSQVAPLIEVEANSAL